MKVKLVEVKTGVHFIGIKTEFDAGQILSLDEETVVEKIRTGLDYDEELIPFEEHHFACCTCDKYEVEEVIEPNDPSWW